MARSGAAWTAIGADVQGDNGLTPAELRAIAASAAPACKVLTELIVLMKRNKGVGNPDVRGIQDVQGCHVADVMTLASFLVGDQMDLRRGRSEVDADGALGFTSETAGPHRLALAKLKGRTYRAEILRRILSAPLKP